jgi:uncharacterized membrane protein
VCSNSRRVYVLIQPQRGNKSASRLRCSGAVATTTSAASTNLGGGGGGSSGGGGGDR